MNWRRGFVRCWIILTISWLAVVVVVAYQRPPVRYDPASRAATPEELAACIAAHRDDSEWQAKVCPTMSYPVRSADYGAIAGDLSLAISVPAVLLLIGFVGRWVIFGFRP